MLSKTLLELPEKRYPFLVPSLINQFILNNQNKIIIFKNIELLFHPSLRQNPLQVLRNISRNQPIISFWPGYRNGNKLVYAKRGHPEYFEDTFDDILVYEFVDETLIRLESGDN